MNTAAYEHTSFFLLHLHKSMKSWTDNYTNLWNQELISNEIITIQNKVKNHEFSLNGIITTLIKNMNEIMNFLSVK